MSRRQLDHYLEVLEDTNTEALENEQYQRRLFEKYVQRNRWRAEERTRLRKLYDCGEPLTGPKGLRRALGAIDLQYFGKAYLAHYYVTDPPPFHDELDRIWIDGVLKGLDALADPKSIDRQEGCRVAIAAPRGHAKSTTITFKDSLHSIVYGYKHYILILSDSSDQAETFLGDIRSELEDNAAIREDFGDLKGGRFWTNAGFLTSTGIKVEGIGSGKKIRGRRHKQWRPDLILLDDIENDTNINTPEQRAKLANWFDKAVSSAGAGYTDILYVGTVLHYDSLLCKVMAKPDYRSVKYQAVVSWAEDTELWETWRQIYTDLENGEHQEDALRFFEDHRERMLMGTRVLWEAKNSYYKLMTIKVSLGDAAFNSEYQNDPLDPSACLFSEETTTFYDDDPPDFSDRRFAFFGSNDPSLGKNSKSDTSSLFALALDSASGIMYVVEADITKRTPDRIIVDAIEMEKRLRQIYRHGFQAFGVESVQFQSFFATVMARESARLGVYLPVRQIPSLLPKQVRIESLVPFVTNGYVRFSRKHKELLKQMFQYPMGRNDDGPDGLEMVVKLAIGAKGTTQAEYTTVQRRGLRFGEGCY